MLSQRFLLTIVCILVFQLAKISWSQTTISKAAIIGVAFVAAQENDSKSETDDQAPSLVPNRTGRFQITQKNLPIAIYNRARASFGTAPITSQHDSVKGKTDIVYEVNVSESYDPEKACWNFCVYQPN